MNIEDILKEDHKICMQFGSEPDHFFGAITPPTYGNSLFVYRTHEDLVEGLKNEQKHYTYWRGTNPTVEIVEKKLAALERGELCKCFASGMAAISAAIINSVKAGDHVLCVSNIYKSTIELLKYFEKFDINYSTIYSTSINEIEKSILPSTKLIYLESPTDSNFELINLQEVAKIARARGIRTIIDNTWATPLFQKPITHGIDIVVHSTSKYLNGHNDLVGGALITNRAIMKDIFQKEYLLLGGIMGPQEAALLLRGLKTLPMRMKLHQKNAMKVASYLDSHPAIKKVHYPGLLSVKNLKSEQLTGFSGLMTFELKNAHYDSVRTVINNVKVFKIGVSWGGFESLIMSPNFGDNIEQLREENVSPGLIRIAVGLESFDVLIADLEQALNLL